MLGSERKESQEIGRLERTYRCTKNCQDEVDKERRQASLRGVGFKGQSNAVSSSTARAEEVDPKRAGDCETILEFGSEIEPHEHVHI